MPYDATIEIDEFRFMDTRDRPERYYLPERDLPPRRPEQYSGPTARQIEQERQRQEQMAAYLATNPEPITGLPRVSPNPLADIVNNPAVTVTAAEVKAINDPKKMMTPQGKIVKRPPGDFSMRSQFPFQEAKRTRRKTKTDKTMSKCLKIANQKLRNKNGKLKKGKSMRDVMKMAHRLCRKENGTKKGMVRKTARRAYEKR